MECTFQGMAKSHASLRNSASPGSANSTRGNRERYLTDEHRVDLVERHVDLLADFRTGEDNFPRDEDEQDDFRLHHPIDQSGEQLSLPISFAYPSALQRRTHFGLVRAELTVTKRQPLQPNRELDVATAHDVLDLELGELGVKAEFLDDPRVFSGGESTVVFRFRAGHDHFPGGEDEGGGFGVSDTHDDSGESLQRGKRGGNEGARG